MPHSFYQRKTEPYARRCEVESVNPPMLVLVNTVRWRAQE